LRLGRGGRRVRIDGLDPFWLRPHERCRHRIIRIDLAFPPTRPGSHARLNCRFVVRDLLGRRAFVAIGLGGAIGGLCLIGAGGLNLGRTAWRTDYRYRFGG
jgi:hypothetical protein